MKKITSFCQVGLLKEKHTKENWFLFFCLMVYMLTSMSVITVRCS